MIASRHKKLIIFFIFLLLVGAGIFCVAGKGRIVMAQSGAEAPAAQTPVAAAAATTDAPSASAPAATATTKGALSKVSDLVGGTLGDFVLEIIGVIVSAFVTFAGWILTLLIMPALFAVARYNGFMTSAAVVNGWVIIRDLCNIFFIVIFLVMTVSTVLGIDEYSYSRILKKLLIMAVLINFSKLICGILIDVSQVIMMTFLNSIGNLSGGYLTYMLGVDTMMNAVKSGARPGFLEVAGSYILVLIYLVVAIATILVITLVLVQRIVMLWIYVVLSPFAYFLSTFPSGASYASKWWSDFTKYITIGPIIAFFLWLSFTSLGNVKNQDEMIREMQDKAGTTQTATGGATDTSGGLQVGITEAGSSTHMLKFIIAIAMLLGGLMVAQTVGGMAGQVAGDTLKGKGIVGGNIVAGLDWMNRRQNIGLGMKGFDTENMRFFGKDIIKKPFAMAANLFLRGSGQDLAPTRQLARFKAGMESNKKEDLSKMVGRAAQIHGGPGISGYVFGTASPDWWDQRAKGPLGLTGIGRAIWSSFQSVFDREGHAGRKEKFKKELDGLRERKKLAMSKSEYDEELERRNGMATAAKGEAEDAKSNPEMDRLKKSIEALTKALEKKDLSEVKKLGGDYVDLTLKQLSARLAKDIEDKDKLVNLMYEKETKAKDTKKNLEDWENLAKRAEKDKVIYANNEIEKAKANLDIAIKEKHAEFKIASEKQAKYTIIQQEAERVHRAAVAEKEKELLSDDKNELLSWHDNAMANNDTLRAEAISKKLMKNVDFNEWLDHYGYNQDSVGLTKEEYAKLDKEGKWDEIEANSGMHDALRDIYGKRMHMDDQRIFALESELSAIAKATNQAIYMEAATSKNGKYVENDRETQFNAAIVHMMKQDPEKISRSGPRFGIGGHKADGTFNLSLIGEYLFKHGRLGKAFNHNIGQGRLYPLYEAVFKEAGTMKRLNEMYEEAEGMQKEQLKTLIKNMSEARTMTGDERSEEIRKLMEKQSKRRS